MTTRRGTPRGGTTRGGTSQRRDYTTQRRNYTEKKQHEGTTCRETTQRKDYTEKYYMGKGELGNQFYPRKNYS